MNENKTSRWAEAAALDTHHSRKGEVDVMQDAVQALDGHGQGQHAVLVAQDGLTQGSHSLQEGAGGDRRETRK